MRAVLLLVVLLVAAMALTATAKRATTRQPHQQRSDDGLNLRPIIGILTQPSDPEYQRYGTAMVPAAYVKWLEAAGARVVPIYYDSPEPVLESMFNSINGLLLIGGDTDLIDHATPYQLAARYLYHRAIQAFERENDYFPIWGTCLGFEQLCILGGNDQYDILGNFDAQNETLPLQFTADAALSRLFDPTFIPPTVFSALSTQPITENYHHNGVTPQAFMANNNLAMNFRILSTNVDRKGVTFISSMEHRRAPIYAVQFHPERPAFEWDAYENTPHSFEAIFSGQYFANFFVQETRKNHHAFTSSVVESHYLIYWCKVKATLDIDWYSQESYFFGPYRNTYDGAQCYYEWSDGGDTSDPAVVDNAEMPPAIAEY